jgi:hypothetical protein
MSEELSALLVRAGEVPGGPLQAPVDRIVGRATVRRRRRRAGVATAAATALALVPAVPFGGSTGTTLMVDPAGGAVRLAGAHWRVLPAPPIASRVGEVAVWTGSRVLIWGGHDPSVADLRYLDGASLDPAIGRWTPIQGAPMNRRTDPVALWTGTEMLVWGGKGANDYLTDGALYDPVAASWRPMPLAPVSPSRPESAVFVRGVAVILLADRMVTFDPARNAWSTVPAPPDAAPDSLTTLVAGGADLYAAQRSASGLALIRYDWTHRRWLGSGAFRLPQATGTPVWTGAELLVVAVAPECQPATCRMDRGRAFRWGDLVVQVVTAPGRPADHAPGPHYVGDQVWTGAALVGDAYVWEPATGIWRALPKIGSEATRGQLGVRWFWAGQGLFAYDVALGPSLDRHRLWLGP